MAFERFRRGWRGVFAYCSLRSIFWKANFWIFRCQIERPSKFMKFELKKYARSSRKDYQNTTDDELIADLRDVAGKLQKDAVTSREYNQKGKFNHHIFERRFGSWLNALGKAGLQKTRNYNITDEEAFQNLENIWIKLGRQPVREELCAPLSKYSGSFYEYRFGSWQKALEAVS